MAGKQKQIVAPSTAPDTAPDESTKKEIARSRKDKAKSSCPPPSTLLNDHREKTELRLIEEVDQARDKHDGLVNDIRNIERAYATLHERHRSLASQRSSSSFCSGIGALFLGIASFNDEKYRLLLVGIGGMASVAALLLDTRASIESRQSPIQKPKPPE